MDKRILFFFPFCQARVGATAACDTFRAVARACRAMAPPSSPPFLSTSGNITLPSQHWYPSTSILQAGDLSFTVLAEDLCQFPIIPHHCQVFGRASPFSSVAAHESSLKLRVLDQGRCFGLQGSMGRGTRLQPQSAPAPADTPLLYFVCVAKGPLCDDQTLEQLYSLLKESGIGSGCYGVWSCGSESFVYDMHRSPGYALNNGNLIRDGVSRRANVTWRAPADPRDFFLWCVARGPLIAGTHLWISYGSESPHHRSIQAARKEARANLPPGPTAKRLARKHCCDAARRAKAAKLAVEAPAARYPRAAHSTPRSDA